MFCPGANNEIYRVGIPKVFHKKLYEEIVLDCFITSQKHIILIAVGAPSKDDSEESEQLIYPAPFGLTISEEMFGYFIAQNKEQASSICKPIRTQTPEQSDEIPLVDSQIEVNSLSNSAQSEVVQSLQESGTELYHKLAEAKMFDDALLHKPTELTDHIVLCTFSEKDSNKLNLCSFVSPLRSCTLQQNEMKEIVIIGNKDCIKKEWNNIEKFDKVFILDGNPLDQDVLKAANVAQFSSCLILGSTSRLDDDPALIDKQPILCSLTLSSPNFSRAASAALSRKHFNKVTELYQEENVDFLDLKDNDENASTFISAQPFACGECISSSVFDALVGVAYYNPGAIGLLEKLVTGEGTSQAKPTSPKDTLLSYRPRFQQISLQKQEYEQFQHQQFATLFKSLLEKKKLCVGVYRCIDTLDEYSKRYVITSPDNDFELIPTDKIIVLESV